MSEANSPTERLLQDPRDRFYEFAEGLFGKLEPDQVAVNLLDRETERKTALRLDDKRHVEVVSVFGSPEDPLEGNDQYSVFLTTIVSPTQVSREDFTIDASAYERKKRGEEVDPDDLMLMTADSARSEGHEVAAELQLLSLLDEIETAPTDNWHALAPEQTED